MTTCLRSTGGFFGEHCEANACDGVDCGPRSIGGCIEGACTCTDGYTGDRCEVLPDPCEYPRIVDCGAHGVCGIAGGCNCTDGYHGSTCESAVGKTVGGSCVGDRDRVCGTITQTATGEQGTTYQLGLTLSGNAANVYTIYGNNDASMEIPASYQEASPFGVNTGGVNPAFVDISASAALDGWLSVGLADGDEEGALGSVGIDFSTWTADAGLSVSNGAIFWMDPDAGPGGSAVVAQITVAGDFTAIVNAQGRSYSGDDDWDVLGVTFSVTTEDDTGCSPLQQAIIQSCSDDCTGCDQTLVNTVLAGCSLAGSVQAVGTTFCEHTPTPPPRGGDGSGGGNCVGNVCAGADQTAAEGPGTTWQITLTLSGSAANVYTIYGDETSPMTIPASYQEGAPFGSNTGGVSPQFTAMIATAAYDGWLTVGITEGDAAGALGNVGIDWDGWTVDTGLSVSNGAVFWLSPRDGPEGSAVVAQFTVAGDWSASFGAQGRSRMGEDWKAANVSLQGQHSSTCLLLTAPCLCHYLCHCGAISCRC